jgi:PAS domain S-box-containing protein
MEQKHSLLKRQLKKYFGASKSVPPEWKGFIEAVDAAYREFDADRAMLERSLELSSQELLRANTEMRAIFLAIPDLLFRFNADGKILDCKTGGTADLYLPPEELLGKRIQDVPPEDVGKKFFEAVQRVQETKSLVSFEYSLVLQGRGSFYEARLLPVLEDQIIAIVRNVTSRRQAEEALKESEEKYRTLVENINVGIYRSNPDFLGHFLQANPAMMKIFGYASNEEFLGTSVAGFYQNRKDRELFLREMVQKGFVKDKELRMKKKDGASIVVSCTGKIQYDAQGGMKWIDGVMEDITERKQAEEEILKTSKLESLGILAGGIAHDFNNILTAIIGNISLARKMAPPESKVLTRLEEAEKASRRAQDLTQQLLTFSKGGAPVKRVASVADLLRDSASFVLSGSNVRCEFSIPRDLLPVDIDEGQISQVINNLVINAKQSMPQGGTISIQAENVTVGGQAVEPGPQLRDGNYIKITIQDRGTGIPEEHLDKIFDPYFTTKETGSGLGLTTTYSIIKKHDGYVTVKSKVNVGTTFSLYLPASEKKAESVRKIQQEPLPGHGKILVMDDEEIVRDAAGSMLRELGYDAAFARDGAEAIELFRKTVEAGGRFDAVIMDLTIPGGMGGREAVTRLLALDPALKVIASSGYSNDPIMADYKKYGFSAIVPKPYEIEDLRKALHRVIAGNGNGVGGP